MQPYQTKYIKHDDNKIYINLEEIHMDNDAREIYEAVLGEIKGLVKDRAAIWGKDSSVS